MATNRRFFHQSFAVPPRNARYLDGEMVWSHHLHNIRDPSALLELANALYAAGYIFGETVLGLYPPGPLDFPPELREGDLLVLSTRPPLDDMPFAGDAAVNPILGSGAPQEKAVLDVLRAAFLAHSSRTELSLRDPIYDRFRHLPALQPRVLTFASRTGRLEKDRSKTVCFVLRVPQVPGLPAKVGCLAAFGMAGTENLLWARALRMEGKLLDLAVANSDEWMIVAGIGTLSPYPNPHLRPLTLAFADGFQNRWELFAAVAPTPAGPWRLL